MPNPYRIGEAIPYRSLNQRTWATLKDIPSDPLRLIMHLWFSEHSTPFGILDLPDPYIEHDLGWRPPRLRRALALLVDKGLVLRDGRLIALPLFLACNLPSNPKVLAGWRTAVSRLPESQIFQEVYEAASAWVSADGLAWLQPKINAWQSMKGYPKPIERLPNSGSGSGAERKEQERGECERGEPGVAAVSEAELFGQGPEALEATNKGNGKRGTKAERMREEIRLFLERELTLGQGLRNFSHWDCWFPRRYDRTILREIFEDVQRAHQWQEGA